MNLPDHPATSASFFISRTTPDIFYNILKNINTYLRNLPGGEPAKRAGQDKRVPAAKIVSQNVEPGLPLRSTTGY
jgi:hypothetical protein